MRTTKKLALSALLAALSAVILFLGSALELIDLSAAAVATLFVSFTLFELGTGFAALLWAVTSVASLLLFPSGASAFYMAIGLYPLLKTQLEKLPPIWEWALKMLSANAILAVYVVMGKFVLMLPDEIFSGWLLWAFLALANLCFVLFDVALSRLLTVYTLRWRPRFARFLK